MSDELSDEEIDEQVSNPLFKNKMILKKKFKSNNLSVFCAMQAVVKRHQKAIQV